MPCGGPATHSAYQPYRAFEMAASATAVGAHASRDVASYGNPPFPSPYPSIGMNPYGPQFPPPPGPAGPVPPRVRHNPNPYGVMPPTVMNDSQAVGAAAPGGGYATLSPSSCTSGSNRYACWPTAAKATLWAAVGAAAFVLALFITIMILRRTRRFV